MKGKYSSKNKTNNIGEQRGKNQQSSLLQNLSFPSE